MNIFLFNPEAVKFKAFKEHGRDALHASYRLPDGRVLEDTVTWSKIMVFVRDNAQNILTQRIQKMFDDIVRELSAHEKMVWKKNSR